jgi:hypothetical protein
MSNQDLKAVLAKISDAGTMAEYAPKLAAGDHVLVLRGPVKMGDTRESGRKLEADFSVFESDTLRETEQRGDVWFIDIAHKMQGHYAQKRFNSFVAAVGAGLGASDEAMMNAIVTDDARGLMVRARSRPALNKDDGSQIIDKKGNVVCNTAYTAYPMTAELIVKVREWLDGHAPVVAAETPAPAPAVAPPSAPATGGSILGRFGISK